MSEGADHHTRHEAAAARFARLWDDASAIVGSTLLAQVI